MVKLMLATVFLAILGTPAFAAPCDDDVRQLQAALAAADLPKDQQAQIADLAAQAKKLCVAGHQEEALDVTAEAKAMLNMQ
jgi:hypothetical protein